MWALPPVQWSTSSPSREPIPSTDRLSNISVTTSSTRATGLRRPERLPSRSEEHTSELQSPDHLVCRLLLEKKKNKSCSPPCPTYPFHEDVTPASRSTVMTVASEPPESFTVVRAATGRDLARTVVPLSHNLS